MHRLKLVKELRIWLLGIAAGLMALHISLIWHIESTDFLGTSVLFWIAVSSLIWKKHQTLYLESSVFSSFLGISIVAWVLLKSARLDSYDPFLRLSPFVSALGLGLLASGIKGLKQYWQEIVLLGFLVIPPSLILALIDFTSLTAKFSVFLLWYLGFNVYRQDLNVILPTGIIEIGHGCSGVTAIIQLLGLAFIFLVMFPTKCGEKILVPVVAAVLGFAINAARIVLLAVLSAFSNHEAFNYWHGGDGSLIFSVISVLIFGFFCRFLLLRDEPEQQKSGEV